MLERVKHENTVDIYGHVTVLRTQRNFMVQTGVSANCTMSVKLAEDELTKRITVKTDLQQKLGSHSKDWGVYFLRTREKTYSQPRPRSLTRPVILRSLLSSLIAFLIM